MSLPVIGDYPDILQTLLALQLATNNGTSRWITPSQYPLNSALPSHAHLDLLCGPSFPTYRYEPHARLAHTEDGVVLVRTLEDWLAAASWCDTFFPELGLSDIGFAVQWEVEPPRGWRGPGGYMHGWTQGVVPRNREELGTDGHEQKPIVPGARPKMKWDDMVDVVQGLKCEFGGVCARRGREH
jgi:hypothetical protein